MKKAMLGGLGILLLGFGALFALEPPAARQIAKYRMDGTLRERVAAAESFGNHRYSPGLVKRFGSRMTALRREALGLPESGNVLPLAPGGDPLIPGELRSKGLSQVFVLLIDFADYPAGNSAASIDDKLFGAGDGGFPYESLSGFYRRSSYGQLEIQGTTLGWYRPSYDRAAVATTTAGRENLIREALLYFDAQGHDFSRYDNDGDGDIDYFLVIWTGPAGEWASFWWGYYTSYSRSLILDGKQFQGTGYSWQWESRPYPGSFSPSTAIHETGHALGLPDLYDYDPDVGPDGGLGGLDCMDAVWGDHNGFSKMVLGWLTPRVFNDGTRFAALRPAGANPDAVVFGPWFSLDDPYTDFFLVQNRIRTGNDIDLPGDGLLIFHVDASLNSWGYFRYDNSYTDHKLVRLMEADGLEEIGRGRWGDAGDYYVPGKRLGPDTIPNSNAYDGTPTATLDEIVWPDETIAFRVMGHQTGSRGRKSDR
jgi:M6 family metalloprotease-like protein